MRAEVYTIRSRVLEAEAVAVGCVSRFQIGGWESYRVCLQSLQYCPWSIVCSFDILRLAAIGRLRPNVWNSLPYVYILPHLVVHHRNTGHLLSKDIVNVHCTFLFSLTKAIFSFVPSVSLNPVRVHSYEVHSLRVPTYRVQSYKVQSYRVQSYRVQSYQDKDERNTKIWWTNVQKQIFSRWKRTNTRGTYSSDSPIVSVLGDVVIYQDLPKEFNGCSPALWTQSGQSLALLACK